MNLYCYCQINFFTLERREHEALCGEFIEENNRVKKIFARQFESKFRDAMMTENKVIAKILLLCVNSI